MNIISLDPEHARGFVETDLGLNCCKDYEQKKIADKEIITFSGL